MLPGEHDQSDLHREQDRLCLEFARNIEALNESSRILADSVFSAGSLQRFRYLSRLLDSRDDELLRSRGASRAVRMMVRRGHFTAFRKSLRSFRAELTSLEQAALESMAGDGASFEVIAKSRLEIHAQLWKLRGAGWAYLLGYTNAREISESAIAVLARALQPAVYH